MARPLKEGLDYFPLNTDFEDDDKVAIIEAEYGNTGYALIVRLLCRIYRNGYYYQWSEKEQILFKKRINVDINEVNVIINDCCKWGFFDKGMFEKFSILTSYGIQKRFIEATHRRTEVKINKKYSLFNLQELRKYKNVLLVNDNDETVEDFGRNTPLKKPESEKPDPQEYSNQKSLDKKQENFLGDKEDVTYKDVVHFWEQNGFGGMTPYASQQLEQWMDDFGQGEAVILKALQIAVENNVRKLRYVIGTLRTWSNAKCRDYQAILAFQKEQETRGASNKNGGKNKKVDWDKLDKEISEDEPPFFEGV